MNCKSTLIAKDWITCVFLLITLVLSACAPGERNSTIPKGGAGHPVEYLLIVLPPIVGDIRSEARALNNTDPVAISGFSTGSDGKRHAIKWTYNENGITTTWLPPINGFEQSVANDINDGGAACGYCIDDDTGERRPVIWVNAYPQDIYLLADEILTDDEAEANSISNEGHVVGWHRRSYPHGSEIIERPFYFYDGDIDDWTTVPIGFSYLNAVISKEGMPVAAGYGKQRDDDVHSSAFLTLPSQSGIGSRHFFEEAPSVAQDVSVIEESSYIVAGTYHSPDGNSRACLWTSRIDEGGGLSWELQDISSHEARFNSAAFAVNNNKTAVGSMGQIIPRYMQEMGDQAFMWSEETGMIILDDLVLPGEITDFQLKEAADINESDWIAGTGMIGGAVRGFLLIPVPGVTIELEKLGSAQVEMTGILEYFFIIENISSEVVDLTITDPLPAGTAYDEEETPPWILDQDVLSLNVTLMDGERRVVPLRLRATGDPGTTIENNEYAYTLPGGEPFVFDMPVFTEITGPPIHIELSKEGPAEVLENGVLQYVFTVFNNSIVPVDVIITDPQPDGTAFDPNITPPWTLTDGILSYSIHLEANGTESVPLRLRVTGEPGLMITNTDYAYAYGEEEPVVSDIPVHTLITCELPDVSFTGDVTCREMCTGEDAVFEPDFEPYSGPIDFVRYFVGTGYLATVANPPYTHTWYDVPPGIHPVRAVAFHMGQAVSEDEPVILLVDVLGDPVICYDMQFLEDLQEPPIWDSWPSDINDRGLIVGRSRKDNIYRPCKWEENVPIQLVPQNGWAMSVTDNQIIVGWYTPPGIDDVYYNRAFMIASDGQFEEITALPEGQNWAWDARNNGQVVVWQQASEEIYHQRGFICQDGIAHQLVGPTEFYYDVIPKVITKRGHVIGEYGCYFSYEHVFVWQAPDHLSELAGDSSPILDLTPYLPGSMYGLSVLAANNTGYIIASRQRIFRYHVEDLSIPAELIQLDLAPPSYTVRLNDINDFTMIIGVLQLENTLRDFPFVYVCGHRIMLEDLVPDTRGWIRGTALAINNNGDIVGSTHGRPFKLTPIR